VRTQGKGGARPDRSVLIGEVSRERGRGDPAWAAGSRCAVFSVEGDGRRQGGVKHGDVISSTTQPVTKLERSRRMVVDEARSKVATTVRRTERRTLQMRRRRDATESAGQARADQGQGKAPGVDALLVVSTLHPSAKGAEMKGGVQVDNVDGPAAGLAASAPGLHLSINTSLTGAKQLASWCQA